MNTIPEVLVSSWQSLPPLVHGIFVLLAGWVLALVLRSVVHGLLALFRFDSLADRVGWGEFLRNGHVTHRPAKLLGLLVYHFTLLIAFLVASRALDLEAVNAITDSLVEALPAITAAVFITAIGLVLVGFLSNVIGTIARNTAITNVRAVVNTFRTIGYVVILLLASDQLGFGKSLLSSLLLIAFAAFAFGVALAFGLGSADSARRVVENFLRDRDLRAGPPTGHQDRGSPE